MDKKEAAVMTRKFAILFVLLAFVILIAGCETIKYAFTGASDGFQQDLATLQEADAWMRDNLW